MRCVLAMAVATGAGLCLLAGCGPKMPPPLQPETEQRTVVRTPDHLDPDEPLRLLVALHGHDQTEEQAVALWDEGFFFEPNFVLVGIRGPFRGPDGYDWFSSDAEVSDLWQVRARRSLRAVEDRVLETVCALQESLGIDPAATFALGFSQGAAAAFYVALRNPDVFAGAAAIAGNLDTSLALLPSPGDIEGMSAFIGLGEDEGPRAVQAVRNSGRLLSQLGLETRVFLYPGGHVVSAACCRAMQNFLGLCGSFAPENDYVLRPSLEPEPGPSPETDSYEGEPEPAPPPDEYDE